MTHKGIIAGTTYNYRVSAYDAAGNPSPWTAACAAATPALPGTQAPSVPTGLVGRAVSSTQINLAWNASTDNVGVTGYWVYLNDAALTATAATSFTHNGLIEIGRASCRERAYDAAGQPSARNSA